MSYRTEALLTLPFEFTCSDSPDEIRVEVRFNTFNNEKIPERPCPQHIGIYAVVGLRTPMVATAAVKELRALADSIEAFIPIMEEYQLRMGKPK